MPLSLRVRGETGYEAILRSIERALELMRGERTVR
jgi:hypothetical protein